MNSAELADQLDQARADAVAACRLVERLELKLQQARLVEAHQDRIVPKVLDRLKSGQWVSGIAGRLWWHSDEQIMIERAEGDDLNAIWSLVKQGIVTETTESRLPS